MLTNIINTNTLVSYEPSLSKVMFEGSTSFYNWIKQGFNLLLNDIVSSGLKPQYLDTPLVIKPETIGGANTSDTSAVDNLSRSLLVIKLSDSANLDLDIEENGTAPLLASQTFVLQGTNDISGTPKWDNILTVTYDYEGIYTEQLPTVYKYYRVSKTTSDVCTYSVELRESVYHNLQLYVSLYLVFNSLASPTNEFWQDKADKYFSMYKELFNSTEFWEDSDSDGNITEGEQKTTASVIRIRL